MPSFSPPDNDPPESNSSELDVSGSRGRAENVDAALLQLISFDL